MHCPKRLLSKRTLFLLGLLLTSLLPFGAAPTHAAAVAAAAKLTPRNFTPSLSAQGVLTVAYDLVNTGSAPATSTRITAVSLLSTSNVRVGTRQSPAALPAAVADIPVGGSQHLVVVYGGMSAGQRTKFSIAFSADGPVGASTGFYLTVPAAQVVPLTLTATPGNGAVTLDYNAVPGAASYSIYASTDPAAAPSTYSYITNTSGTTYTQTGLSNGTTYYYVVVPVDSVGNAGTPSNNASALVQLPAPTGLTATPGDSAVTLTFTPAADLGVDYTQVYVSTDANAALSSYTYIGSADASGTSYTQTGLTNGTTYYYYVVSHNAGGPGTPSATVNATIPVPASLSAPTSLTGTHGNGIIRLSWIAPTGAVSFYNVKRSTVSGGPYTTISTAGAVKETTYDDTSVVNGTTYYYIVTAVATNGTESVPSNQAAGQDGFIGTGLVAAPGDGSVTITYDAIIGATNYQVFGSTDGVNFNGLGFTGNVQTFTQNGLTNGRTYYYYVVPYNTGGPGTASATVSATPAAPAT